MALGWEMSTGGLWVPGHSLQMMISNCKAARRAMTPDGDGHVDVLYVVRGLHFSSGPHGTGSGCSDLHL